MFSPSTTGSSISHAVKIQCMNCMLLVITMEDWEEGIILHLLRMGRVGMILMIAQLDRSIAKIFREIARISFSTVGRINDP